MGASAVVNPSMSSKMAGHASSRFSQTAVDELALERHEEGLRQRGGANPAYGADQARLAHVLSVGQRGVLAAVVGVVDHAGVGLAFQIAMSKASTATGMVA